MTMPSALQVQPYLFCEGRCEEALAFYRGALGAEVTMLMRFKESPIPAWSRRARATLLFPALRHGRRPLRRVLDGLRDAMSAGHRGEGR
jgi:uncharacterized glyoxalase superfamily protein PhnB